MPKPNVQKVANRHLWAMARANLVVDENHTELINPLKDLNFRVVTPVPRTTDPEIIKTLCSGRVLVTENLKDFESYAAVDEFSIISIRSLNFIDPEPKNNVTAKLISDAWGKLQLASYKGRPFILHLHDNGKHKLEFPH